MHQALLSLASIAATYASRIERRPLGAFPFLTEMGRDDPAVSGKNSELALPCPLSNVARR